MVFLDPGDEAALSVLQLLPDDLDHGQFGTVGGQVEQERVVIDQPALSRCLIDAVMDSGIVQHDHGSPAVADSEQVIDEALDMRPLIVLAWAA